MKKLILFLSIACFASWAGAQSNLYDTSVSANTNNFPDNYNYSSSDEIYADDAVLASPGIITSLEVEFVNSGVNATGNTTADIVFALWAEDGTSGNPSTTPLWSSGLTSLTFLPGNTADLSSFATTVTVPVPSVAVAPKVYWSAEVHNLVLAPAAFGSQAFGLRRIQGLSPDDTWADLTQAQGATPTWVQATDNPLSVTIFGVAVPEPSIAGLFLIGLACLGTIRKLKTM